MHCVGKKEIMDRCFPCRSRFIIHKTCLQGRFQPVSIRGNKTSDMEKKPYRLFLCCYIYREVLLANGQSGRGNEKRRTKKALFGLFSFSIEKRFWRRHPDLNWGSRCCRPLPYHLAIAPIGADYEARTRYLHLGKVALYQMS